MIKTLTAKKAIRIDMSYDRFPLEEETYTGFDSGPRIVVINPNRYHSLNILGFLEV